ncbi:hypothetical protein LP316_08790 [Thalassotalea sp. LPB0316]|uniref:LPS-assembly lipoprotein LptE n=1 Tax=Thalassotalea sp. LPB0316 TaxID=2769490 RepID=UPI001866C216|nr:LPS assembly lipoprotein LptE [Thalassotalea sp. LPB0316]QOL24463.1 hypothetical protein LP316_08790 [Thalassotalea sp. LPB0316]
MPTIFSLPVKQLQKLFFTLFLTCSIASCGFQLRGQYLLPEELQTLYVSSEDNFGELTRLVKQHLTINDVTVLESATSNTPELRILRDQLNRRTLSVFPNGQVAEYELIYTVNYQITMPEQEVQNFRFDLYREYQDDPNFALAKSRELNLLLSEMRKRAAERILRELASVDVSGA